MLSRINQAPEELQNEPNSCKLMDSREEADTRIVDEEKKSAVSGRWQSRAAVINDTIQIAL